MKNPSDVSRITLTALFTALMIAGTYIRIPLGPVPVILTTLFVLAAGAVLGPTGGVGAVLFYLILGALGLPVFSRGGGLALFAGPTGGFLLGYLPGAFITGLVTHSQKTSRTRDILAILGGSLVIYLPGLPWLKHSLNLDWIKTISLGFLPFLPGDLLKGAAVYLLLVRLRRSAPDFFLTRKKNGDLP